MGELECSLRGFRASTELTLHLSCSVVSKLLSLALRTAGAEMCLLVLDKGGTLCAEAIAKSSSSETQHLRRLDAIDVQPDRCQCSRFRRGNRSRLTSLSRLADPCSVINYVARSKAMVVNTLDALGESISDPYLNREKPLSILCLALANQQRVIGVMYMENSQTRNAFVSAGSAAELERFAADDLLLSARRRPTASRSCRSSLDKLRRPSRRLASCKTLRLPMLTSSARKLLSKATTATSRAPSPTARWS